MYKYILCFTLSFLFSYEVGDQVGYFDQIKEYPICYGSVEHGFEEDGVFSFSNFNGSNSDFHVFFIDISATWCGPCWSYIPTMSDAEQLYSHNDNVMIFTSLNDMNQPYSCEDWGDRGVQFDAVNLIVDNDPSQDLMGKFGSGAWPSLVFIDHNMTVVHKQSGGAGFSLVQSLINGMLDDLYSALLISSDFEIDFNDDVDSDGLMNPGDSFDVSINVMNKSHSDDNTAMNVNLELVSESDNLLITSSSLGEIGDIVAGETYSFEVNIKINESIKIDDYNLNLVISTDNVDDDGELLSYQFTIPFSVTLNQVGFPVNMSGELISSAAIVDFDNDGQDEIISSDKGGFVHVFEMDGTEWTDETFPYETGDQNWGSPAVGDLDGDEFDDVIISSKNGQIYHIDSSDGSTINSIFNSGGFITATPALGDIDGDGLDEIIFGQYGGSQRLYAINFDGSNVAGFPVDLDQKVQRGAALADFNGNGKMDIVVGTDDEFVHLIHDDGTIAWSYETGGDIRVAPTVLELSTGEKIVLVGSKDDNFYALNSNGILHFMIETDDDISTEASVVDIDGVGPVIFFASGSMLYGVESNGDIYDDWSINLDAEVISSITFASLEGYDLPLVIFGDDSGKAHMYTMDGNSYNNFPISYDFSFKGSPTILDTDNDNDLELILGSTQNLVSIDVKEPGAISELWNTHRANMNRSVYYLSTIDALDVSDDITDKDFSITSVYPNPFNPSVSIDYFIETSDFIEINVMNLQGKIIENLESSFKTKGEYSITWSPNNISSGVYLLNISTSNKSASHKLMFIK